MGAELSRLPGRAVGQAVQRTAALEHEEGVTSPTDAELLRRSRRDPDAFGLLYERDTRPVAAFLARRVGGPVAEDLLGEVFAGGFTARCGWSPARAARRRPGCTASPARSSGPTCAGDPASPSSELHQSVDGDAVDDRLDAGARRAELRVALSSLPLGERDLLLLVAWEGLSVAEAGPGPRSATASGSALEGGPGTLRRTDPF